MIGAPVAWVAGHVRGTLRADVREGLAEGAGLLLIGYVVRFAAGLAGGALVARALGPGPFGAYAVVGAAIAIGITLADFGFSPSATRQIAGDLERAPQRAFRSAAAFARLRLCGGALVFVAALALAGPIADLLALPDPDGPWLVRLAGATVLAAAANGVPSTIHHSLRRYRSLVIGQVSTSAAVLAGLAVLFLLDRLTLTAAVAMGIVGSLFSFALGLALLPPAWRSALRRPAPWRSEDARRLRGFAGWLGISAIMSILGAQLDLLIVGRLLDPTSVGIYGLALALAFKADTFNQIIRTALLPSVSAVSHSDHGDYVRRSFVRSALLTVPLLLALPLVGPFITAVYGPEFAPAAHIVYLLMAVVVFDLFTQPLLLLAYPLNLPRWIAASDAVSTAILTVACVALIPVLGLEGAVLARLLAKVCGALVRGFAIARHFGAERRGAGLIVPTPDTASAP